MTNPLYRSEHYILIWKKTLEEMLLYLAMDCPEVTCHSESVLNFSEDPAIRDSIIKVRSRILDVLEKEGYEEFISVPFKGLALNNKQDPYHWMFFLDKAFPKIENKREIPIPYDPEAYIEEYKRLHHLILTMINEAPELKPYLRRPVVPRDLELNYMCSQQVWNGGKFIEAYDHLIYRTHSHLMMNWQKCSVSHVLKRKGTEIPLEEFFQKIGI